MNCGTGHGALHLQRALGGARSGGAATHAAAGTAGTAGRAHVPGGRDHPGVTARAGPLMADPLDFTDRYNTPLDPQNEVLYQAWLRDQSQENRT